MGSKVTDSFAHEGSSQNPNSDSNRQCFERTRYLIELESQINMHSCSTSVESGAAGNQSDQNEHECISKRNEEISDFMSNSCNKISARSTTIHEQANRMINPEAPSVALTTSLNIADRNAGFTTPRRNNYNRVAQEPPCIWQERARAWQAHNNAATHNYTKSMSRNIFDAELHAPNVHTTGVWSVLDFNSESQKPSLFGSEDLPSFLKFDNSINDSRKRRFNILDLQNSPTTPKKKSRTRSRESPPNSSQRLRSFRQVSAACKKRLFTDF